MNYSFRTNKKNLPSNPEWGWLLVWGILLAILGALAISVAGFTTMLSVIFLGVVIFISGVILLIDTFKYSWGRWGSFSLNFIMSLLYIIVGIALWRSPVLGSISLTLLLGVFYLVIGISRIAYYLSFRVFQWGWGLFNGIISLLLGIFILANWPASSLFIIGLFVGIDLLVLGWVYIMAALSARG